MYKGVKTLRIYLSKVGDTIRTIAKKFYLPIEHLLALNKQFAHSDSPIAADSKVVLPPPELPVAQPALPPFSSVEGPDYLDSWIPLTPIEKMEQTDYDVLIVGSGAGGGAALWRLCEQWGREGKRIGVIEAGNALLPTHSGNIPTLIGEQVYKLKFGNADVVGKYVPEDREVSNILALGGRTLFWSLESPRIHPSEFKEWPFSYKELVPYYLIAENIMNVTTSYTEDSALQEMLLERARFGGFPDAETIPVAADLEASRYGIVHSNVFFSSIICMARALNIRPFDLAVNTRAVQVLTEKGKAAGARVMTADKKEYTLSAKNVILSASTWETPRLLLHSGIPGESIGHYLVDHSYVRGTARAKRSDFPEVIGASKILVPDTDERMFQLLALGPGFYKQFEERKLSEYINFAFQSYGAVEPRYENYVSLNPVVRDDYGVPLLDIHFSFSKKDDAVIQDMFAVTKSFISALGMSMAEPLVLHPPGIVNHEAGTCRLGSSPSNSATNPYGQIHGIEGLYVADKSVLPLNSGSNPTLTTIALAIRTADHIVETMK